MNKSELDFLMDCANGVIKPEAFATGRIHFDMDKTTRIINPFDGENETAVQADECVVESAPDAFIIKIIFRPSGYVWWVNKILLSYSPGPSPFVRQKEFERLIVRQEDTLETTWRIDLEYLEDENSHDRTNARINRLSDLGRLYLPALRGAYPVCPLA